MNDDVKIFVNNQIKEYFQSNVLSYFKYVNEDIKQIDKEIEQISEEQNRLSLVLSSDPTKITKKDRELIDIINAYISKVNNIKKDAEESLQQVINDLDSKAIKDKKDATWICSKHLKEGRKSCLTVSLRESELNNIFSDLLEKLNIFDNVYSLLISKYNVINKRSLTNKTKKENLTKNNKKLLNLYLDNVITKSELAEMININNKKIVNLNKKETLNMNLETINSEVKKLVNSKQVNEILIEELLKMIVVKGKSNYIRLEIYVKQVNNLKCYKMKKKFIRDNKRVSYQINCHFD